MIQQAVGDTPFSGRAVVAGLRMEDGSYITCDVLRRALPGFMARGGALHAERSDRAVGRVVRATVDDKGLFVWFEVHSPGVLLRLRLGGYRTLGIEFVCLTPTHPDGRLGEVLLEEIFLWPTSKKPPSASHPSSALGDSENSTLKE